MKLSKLKATPFSGATETVTATFDDETFTAEVAVTAVTAVFLLQDTIEHATRDAVEAEDDEGVLEGFRDSIRQTIAGLVRSWELEYDDDSPVGHSFEDLEEHDTLTLYKILSALQEALAGAPFVQAQLKRSVSGPNRATRRKKR